MNSSGNGSLILTDIDKSDISLQHELTKYLISDAHSNDDDNDSELCLREHLHEETVCHSSRKNSNNECVLTDASGRRLNGPET